MTNDVNDQLAALLKDTLPPEPSRLAKKESKKAALEPKASRPAKKLRNPSVIIRDGDNDRVNAILDVICQQTGERGKFSDAVRVALDLCPLDGDLIEKAFYKMRAQDRR